MIYLGSEPAYLDYLYYISSGFKTGTAVKLDKLIILLAKILFEKLLFSTTYVLSKFLEFCCVDFNEGY